MEVLGDITIVEEPEVMRTSIHQVGDSNGDYGAALTEARVYRNLISSSALHEANVCCKARPKLNIPALRRLKKKFRINENRGISADIVNSKTRKTGFAVSEKAKWLSQLPGTGT